MEMQWKTRKVRLKPQVPLSSDLSTPVHTQESPLHIITSYTRITCPLTDDLINLADCCFLLPCSQEKRATIFTYLIWGSAQLGPAKTDVAVYSTGL